MCSIKEDVCKARMEKVEDIGEDVTKLSGDMEAIKDDFSELKKELAISITYQKEQTKALSALKEEIEKLKEKKHPLSNMGWVVLGGVIVFLVTKLIELI